MNTQNILSKGTKVRFTDSSDIWNVKLIHDNDKFDKILITLNKYTKDGIENEMLVSYKNIKDHIINPDEYPEYYI